MNCVRLMFIYSLIMLLINNKDDETERHETKYKSLQELT